MKRRTISLLLIVCIVMQTVPVSAFALNGAAFPADVDVLAEYAEDEGLAQQADKESEVEGVAWLNEEDVEQATVASPESVPDDELQAVEEDASEPLHEACNDVEEDDSSLAEMPVRNLVTEPEEAVVLLDGSTPVKTRDTVLILDNSVSMEGSPIVYLKQAAVKFCNTVLARAEVNRVAIVSYDTTVSGQINFTNDKDALSQTINEMDGEGSWTDINIALKTAISLLASSQAEVRNIVIMTDGVPTHGDYKSTGRYSISDYDGTMRAPHYCYEYANALYETYTTIENDYFVYSLGFFHNLSSKAKPFAVKVLQDIQNAGYYEVTSVDDLEFAFDDIAEEILGGTQFNYAGEIVKDRDSSAKFVYKDDYFLGNALEDDRNPSLATMSLVLALSTFSSHVYKDNWYKPEVTEDKPEFWTDVLVNVKTLLLGRSKDKDEAKVKEGYGGIGFSDFLASDDWKNEPTKDSIGVVAARKTITDKNDEDKKYTLIALPIRGGGYGSEWASNLTVGLTGEHAGFMKAKDDVLSFLKNQYLPRLSAEERQQEIKLWIVGFSRAGATANMVAGELNKHPNLGNGLTVKPENIYCYTFETPKGILVEDMSGNHANIHNTVNVNDLVPYVAPEGWKFTRYNLGKDWLLPSATTSTTWEQDLEKMKTEMRKLGYNPDDWYAVLQKSPLYKLKIHPENIFSDGSFFTWEAKDEQYWIPVSDVLVQSVDLLASDLIGSWAYYYEKMQYAVREVLGIVMYYDGKIEAGLGAYAGEVLDMEKFMEDLSQLFTFENMKYIFAPMFSLNPFYSYEKRIDDVEQRLFSKMGSVFAAYAGIKGFVDALKKILSSLVLEIAKDLWDKNIDTIELLESLVMLCRKDFGDLEIDDETYKKQTFSLANAHYPEVCLSWVRSQDPNFNGTAQEGENYSAVTRIIHINCPVDVTVKNQAGDTLVTIINDVVSTSGSIIASLNGTGEKIVFLPGDGDYTLDINATDNGEVYYSVDEYNYLLGTNTRLVNFNGVPVSTGDSLSAIVPAITDEQLVSNDPDGSTTNYRLLGVDSADVPLDEQKGDQIQNCSVTVKTEGNGGYALGTGEFLKGTFAQVEASALPGSEFLGWFDKSNTLLNADSTYRFPVQSDTVLTAKFKDVEFYELTYKTSEGGTIVNSDDYCSEGVVVSLEATPNPGYAFVNWETQDDAQIADATSATTTLTMPAHSVQLTANFTKTSQDVVITYASGGGSGSMPNGTATVGTPFTLPACGFSAPSGQQFSAWNINGAQYAPGASYTFIADTTVTAVWRTITYSGGGGGGGGSSVSYQVALPSDLTGGTVASNHQKAASGTKVTLTVTPDEGYELEKLEVTKDDKTTVDLTEKNSKKIQYTFIMPSAKVTVTASFKQISDDSSDVMPSDTPSTPEPSTPAPSTPSAPEPDNPFTDISPSSAFYPHILWAVGKKITMGSTATTFNPDGGCTRAQAVTFLWRAAGEPDVSGDSPFTDVNDPDRYFYKPVLWAVQHGITSGVTGTTFEPYSICTRAQIVTFLYRMSKDENVSGDNPFTDIRVSSAFYTAILWAVDKGITNGVTETEFQPSRTCSRAHIVTFIHRYMGD